MQLGHPIGEKCLNPERAADDDFTVISAHGIQGVAIDFCGCGKSSQDHVIQLLRARLFPATVKYPKTAATFDCLETFEKLSYVSKISAFEFYHTASRLTDDTGTKTPKVSLFPSFSNLKYWTYQSRLSHRISICHLSEWHTSGDIWKWRNVLGEDTIPQALTKQRKANVRYYALLALSQERTCLQDGKMSPRIDSKYFSMVIR